MRRTKVAFISDTHGNSPALEAVLNDIARYGIDELVVLGDMYIGVDPHGCMELLRQCKIPMTCICGNAESYLLTPNRDQLARYGMDWAEWVAKVVDWCEERLTDGALDWIRSWPLTLDWREGLLVHDSPFDRVKVETEANPILRPEHREWFYHRSGIWWNMSEKDRTPVFEYMQANGYQYLFCGHGHIPFIHERDGNTICCPGSAGAPLDGNWRPSWMLVELGEDGVVSIVIHRIMYDLTKIYALIDAATDFPDFVEDPVIQQAYKKGYKTGYQRAVFVPGWLPDFELGFDVEDVK